MTAPRTIQECSSTFKGLKEARKSRNDYATGVWLLWCSCQRDLFSSALCSLRPLCVGVSVWGHHLCWPYFYWFNMLKKKRTNTHLHSLSCRGHTGVGSVDLFRSTCQLFCVGQYSCVPWSCCVLSQRTVQPASEQILNGYRSLVEWSHFGTKPIINVQIASRPQTQDLLW